MELEGDRGTGVPLEVVDVGVRDRLQRLLRERRLPALANQVLQRLLADVLGELPLHEGGGRFSLAEPGKPGPLLVGGGGARLGLLYLLYRHGDGERCGTRLFAGLLDLDGGHATVNLIGGGRCGTGKATTAALSTDSGELPLCGDAAGRPP